MPVSSIIPSLISSGGSGAYATQHDPKQRTGDAPKTGKQTNKDVLVIAEGKMKQNGSDSVELSEVKTHTVVGRWTEWQMAGLQPGKTIRLADGKGAIVLHQENKRNTVWEDFSAGTSSGIKLAFIPAVINIGLTNLRVVNSSTKAAAAGFGWLAVGLLAASVLRQVGSGLLERKQENSKDKVNTAR